MRHAVLEQMPMEATLLEEAECVVAVGATKIVQEVKGGAATQKMVDVVGLLLTEEVETCPNEVAATLRQPNNWREHAHSTLFRASSIPKSCLIGSCEPQIILEAIMSSAHAGSPSYLRWGLEKFWDIRPSD